MLPNKIVKNLETQKQNPAMKKPSQILEKAALLVFESMSMSKPYDKIPGCVAIDKVMGYVTLSKEDCLLREETFHYFHLCHPGGFFCLLLNTLNN